jgi:two-component sensor histidine kinase
MKSDRVPRGLCIGDTRLAIGAAWAWTMAVMVRGGVAHAGGGLPPNHGSGWWLMLWIALLAAAVTAGYIQQSRRAGRQTTELRRELFERQMAEKELLARDQQLRQSLTEKESLLKEIHHRVKNNLQIVSSLLYLQEEYMDDPDGVEILRESQNRVKSMALIHEQLYGTSDLAKIDFGRYIQGLTANLFDAYGIDPACIRLKVRADDMALGVDMAVPCGLIINELVSNALKHAYPDGAAGTIQVAIQRLDTGRLEIVVTDDGVGMPAPPADAPRQSLGLRLVDTLITQLDGTLTIDTNNGTRFCIILESPPPR